MMITTLLIAVPTGVKVFNWLGTLWEGRIHFATPMLWALGFISTFVIGGLSGVYLGAVPIDIHTSDTYFIVAHIHYVLFGGAFFTIMAGVYYWFPKMTGRMYNETLGKIHFWTTFIAFNLTFFPMHLIGTQEMPRRVADYVPRSRTGTSSSRSARSRSARRSSSSSTTSSIRGSTGRSRRVTRGARSRSSGRSLRRLRSSTSTRSRR